MTTAHRPTYHAATGGGGGTQGYWSAGGAISAARTVRDLPSQLTLKTRQLGQNSLEETRARDREVLKNELFRKEASAGSSSSSSSASSGAAGEGIMPKLLAAAAAAPGDGEEAAAAPSYDDADDVSSDESSSSDDEDDEDEELMRELERIKAEREVEAARKAEEEAALQAMEFQEEALLANPLMATSGGEGGSARVKRRWNDDVVFKNQARGAPKLTKRFINDTVRNDFHRRFLTKYVQ